MTEQEFVAWAYERTRAEWVNGEVTIMSPVNLEHDQLQGWIARLIADFVEENNLGQVCGSEFWLRLPNAKSLRLTDLFFVATGRESGFQRASKSNSGPPTCFNGAPDLIVEIVSDDSVGRDYKQKLKEYESAGVREYWIIDPLALKVIANSYSGKKFHRLPEKKGAIRSKVLPGFFLRPFWLWQKPLPRKSAALQEINEAR